MLAGTQGFNSENREAWSYPVLLSKWVAVLNFGLYMNTKIGHDINNEFNPDCVGTVELQSVAHIRMRYVGN